VFIWKGVWAVIEIPLAFNSFIFCNVSAAMGSLAVLAG